MEFQSKAFDAVKFEKEEANASFNRMRAATNPWHAIIKVAVVFAAVSWCSPAVASLSSEFSTTRVFFNHHVVFLIGNAIIVSLMMLCRQSGADVEERRDVYDYYEKYSEAAAAARASPTPREEEVAAAARASPPPREQEVAAVVDFEFEFDVGDKKKTVSVGVECDDVAETIQKAARQIRRFQRTQSERLRREIGVRPELRRSVTERRMKMVSSEAAEIEKLSNEEFRRRVEAFIDEYWIKRAAL